ncbi:MAG: hypothetical protein DRG78_06165 [Epsilonproteobacteria bacterium]|nr:MAG: hypothetical protein DRG78_06165 [Campylobacterota bacterium]
MNKKAISLIEVMVSIALISTVIVTILKIKDNNLFYIDKFKKISLNNGYISLVSLPSNEKIRGKTIRVSDKINLNDDDIRKELKNIKIMLQDKKIKNIELPKNAYIKDAKVIKSTYSIETEVSKVFYTFKFVQ